MPSEICFTGLALVITLTIIILFSLLAQRRKLTEESHNSHFALKHKILYGLRLAGFTFLIILLLSGEILVYVDYQIMLSDLAPTPSQVEIPSDLPFQAEEVSFVGGDGLRLAGWYLPSANGATIILLHGYGSNRLMMRWHAETLIKAGYGVLMYDERASGESDGQRRSYGWEDAPDVGGALDFLNSRKSEGQAKIGIVGCSIGGQIALQGAAKYPQIAAVWADGPSGVRAKDTPIYSWQSFISHVSTHILDQMYIRIGGIAPPPAIVDTIGIIDPRPIQLVAGGKPHPLFGPEHLHVEHFLPPAGPQTKLWVIPEATHCDGPIQRPEDYARRMVEFFDEAFNLSR